MPSTGKARYLDVLSRPDVPRTFLSALLARSAYALVILPLFFAVQATSGSVATAGIAVAGYGVTASFLAPLRARLIDRHGRRLVLLLLALGFGGFIAVMATGALLSWSGTVMVVLAALAGAVAPPIGPSMRVAWAELAPQPALLRKALSFDSVVEELLYLVGPAASGFALAAFAPGWVLLVPAVLVIAGTVLFVSSPAIRRDSAIGVPEAATVLRRPTLLGNPRFLGLLMPAVVAGLLSGNLTIAVPAAFPGTSGVAAAGIVLGLFAGGSAVGGLLFGAFPIAGRPRFQVILIALVLSGLSTVVGVTLGLAGSGFWMAAAIVATGLFFSPVMIVAYFGANDFGGDTRKTESTTWVNTSHNIGAAAGSAVAGIVIQASGVPESFFVAGAISLALLAAAWVLASRRA
jgi:predicted MFS family arabinose efflux permease